MTHRHDVATGRDIVARWCALAEQRLEYLTELFETGRWRRFHSELALLENIQEAKTAVEIWRDLSMRETSRDNSASDTSWLGRTRATLPRSGRLYNQVQRPQPAKISAEPPPSVISIVPETDSLCSEEAPSAPAMERASELTPDMTAIAERYPLLRNAF
jgi:uncharacterized repeat protein (TIGR03809 family)